MPNTSTLRLNAKAGRSSQVGSNDQSGEDVTLTLDSSKPVTVRIEVDHCPCGSEHRRAGSYTDSDFSR
ncbi:hypothetical protein [Arthrobacter sp. StoSoilB20]|uniref:hypothetical protein n=1 Tax=Arthrobacter sp. StoSoilB20 TaxID=2830995 RepID=UPI001CC7A35B|nr:hypothetical protein [Arthrobacter sp. StoSoilB20]BCW57172.1 hypothetical protein StoSoilB20_05190 [Arthrobacter sp. StoSoilB20]